MRKGHLIVQVEAVALQLGDDGNVFFPFLNPCKAWVMANFIR